MASDILHIKDSYYFEIPKKLAPATFTSKADYPARLNVWVRLDDQFQDWEFHRLYHGLEELSAKGELKVPGEEELHHQWQHWVHGDHAHHGKPFRVYVDEQVAALNSGFRTWVALKDKQGELVNEGQSMQDYIAAKHPAAADMAWALPLAGDLSTQWTEVKDHASNDAAVAEFKKLDDEHYNWDQQKIDWYNHHLSGKLVIPHDQRNIDSIITQLAARYCGKRELLQITRDVDSASHIHVVSPSSDTCADPRTDGSKRKA